MLLEVLFPLLKLKFILTYQNPLVHYLLVELVVYTVPGRLNTLSCLISAQLSPHLLGFGHIGISFFLKFTKLFYAFDYSISSVLNMSSSD
jgi:hypothetical protein